MILCIVLCIMEIVLTIVEGGTPDDVGVVVVIYLTLTTFAVITVFGKLGPHPAKYDDIAEWTMISMSWLLVPMLLVWSLTNWDLMYLVLTVLALLGLAVHTARKCGLIAAPLAAPPTTPPFSRLSRDSRCNIWIVLQWAVFLLIASWGTATTLETVLVAMMAISCGIVACTPSIDYADATDAETLAAQQEESVTSNYQGMPV